MSSATEQTSHVPENAAGEMAPEVVYGLVRGIVGRDPKLLQVVVTAATDGVQDAIDAAYEARGKTDAAFRVLLGALRRPSLLKEPGLVRTVIAGMPETGRCESEKDFVRRYGDIASEGR